MTDRAREVAVKLNEAIALAAQAHAGQVDKAGQPYILHVLRVMLGCRQEDERIAAALHDTVEDCGFAVSDIRAQFGDEVAVAVDALSRRKGETYAGFVERCAANSIARVVKLADLADNMNLARLGDREPTAEDARRQQRYSDARARLMQG